jgi:hypothetical protein
MAFNLAHLASAALGGAFLGATYRRCRVSPAVKSGSPTAAFRGWAGAWILDDARAFNGAPKIRYRFTDGQGKPTRFVYHVESHGNTNIPKGLVLNPQDTARAVLNGDIRCESGRLERIIVAPPNS